MTLKVVFKPKAARSIVGGKMRKVRPFAIYSEHISLEGIECFYCGQYGNTIDHVPPLSLVNFYKRCTRLLVKACRECNSTLGGRILPTIISRVEFLIQRYNKKYRGLIKMPEWEKEEIETLSGRLKNYIKIETDNKSHIHKRLLFLENRLGELLEGF